ncbi:uncharacterized protein [Haliotis cracherodii]|uniref:uncharacterized protein n=1 Tax=Haliotis cracherodii TaxID=6455 RepID=UPI0039EA50EF
MRLFKGRAGFLMFGLAISAVCTLLFLHYRITVPKKATDDQRISVVLTFPYLLDPTWNSPGYSTLSLSQKEARAEEYITGLSRTLIHPHIHEVHLLYDQDLLPDHVNKKLSSVSIQQKLFFHYLQNTRQALSTFRFAFEKLQGRLVMVTQADVYPERGFDLIDIERLKSERLMYALTRHGRLEESCDMSGDFCDEGRKFVGSHDTYIFVPQGRLTASAIDSLTTDTMAWGIDLVITWVFQNVLSYRVLNPCKVVFVYHIHCTYIRNTGRQRVNTVNTTGWIPPTSDLY